MMPHGHDYPEPDLPDPGGRVDGAATLDEVEAFITRYVAFPSEHCAPMITLWAAHTYAVEAFYVSPRLVLDSAEPSSGKTRVLEVLNLLVREPEMILSPTTAAIFRMLAERPYTLLFDETDAVFNVRNTGNYEDLRALLNAGYKRGSTIPRCVGDAAKMKVQRFKVFSPVALAGIAGNMPSTITSRAVTVHMRRRGPGETVEPFEEEDAVQDAAPLQARLQAWVGQLSERLRTRPPLPGGVVDRPAEVWRALVAVADAAGGDWPKRAREACSHFVTESDRRPPSLGVRLLRDLRTVFGDADRMSTEQIVTALRTLSESPWSDLYGKPLDATGLAKRLEPYDVRSHQFKLAGVKVRGYSLAGDPTRGGGLYDAFQRYPTATEPADDPDTGGTPGTGGTSQVSRSSPPTGTPVPPGTSSPSQDRVPGAPGTPVPETLPLTSAVPEVPAVPAGSRCTACQCLLHPAYVAHGYTAHPYPPCTPEPAA